MNNGITIPVGPEVSDKREDEDSDIHMTVHPGPDQLTDFH